MVICLLALLWSVLSNFQIDQKKLSGRTFQKTFFFSCMFSKVSDIVEGFWEVGSGAKKGFKSVQIRIAASFLSFLRKYVVMHWFYGCRRHELGPTIGAHSYTDNMCRLGVEVMLCEKNLGCQTNKLQSSFMACSLPAWRFTSAPNLIENLPAFGKTQQICVVATKFTVL